jgi:hypothetical protein
VAALLKPAHWPRVIFLIPGLAQGWLPVHFDAILRRMPHPAISRKLLHRYWSVDTVYGGTLNVLRQCEVARQAGFDAVIATTSGRNDYGEVFGPGRQLPFIAWSDRRPVDICVIPDYASRLADDIRGPVVIYQQSPLHLHADFDHDRGNVSIWTDSPFMLARCRALFPGKEIAIVPNVVDNALFPFMPQHLREPGLLFAFPRKNPEFIDATWQAYTARGGRYWRLKQIQGLSIRELAIRFQEPQAFLASAKDEGCALPPQEAMAAGILVIGRSASGANFDMKHRETALVAETPEDAATQLFEAESTLLRERITRQARQYIDRYFPDHEPLSFWKDQLRQIAIREAGAHGNPPASIGEIWKSPG